MKGLARRPFPAAISVQGPSRCDGPVISRGAGDIARDGSPVAMLDQHPLSSAAITLGPHDDPGAMHPLAFHDELQLALTQCLADLFEPLLRGPIASVPEHHGAAAILPFRDCALEIAVVEGVILDLHGQTPIARVKRWPLGDRPGLEDPVIFEAQIKMQMAGRVLLDDEAQPIGGDDLVVPRRLRGFVEIPHRLIPGKPRCRHHPLRSTLKLNGVRTPADPMRYRIYRCG